MHADEGTRKDVDGGPAARRRAVRASALLQDLTAGSTVGLLTVTVSVSLPALLYTGELRGFLASGIGLALFSSLAIGLAVALLGSLPGGVALVQDAPAAVLAGAAAGLLGGLPAASLPIERFMTLTALVALTTLATGAAFLAVGLLRLGRMVRYIPYPVVGGFMAGTGWLLLAGAIGVMAGVHPSAAQLLELAAPGVWTRWLPGLALALVIVLVTRASRHFLVWPALLVGAIGAFYLTLVLSGGSLAAWRAAGLLLGPFPDADLLRPVGLADLRHVHWPSVAGSVATVGSVVFLSLMALLFNATGMELASDRKVDLNRELRAAGLGNLLAGAVGGLAGYQALSFTILNRRAGTGGRVASLTALAMVAATLLFGASLLAYMPTVVVGGLLAYLGLSFLLEWVVDAFGKLSRLEYAIVLLILAVIAAVGFLAGVGVGLVLAVALFVVSYSRIDAVRLTLTGRSHRSRVRRDERDQALLRERGDAVLILQLQGFLFFGTANGVVAHVERRLAAPPPLACLILDFRRVTGLDATAIASFTTLSRLAETHGFVIGLAEPSPALRKQLEPAVRDEAAGRPAEVFGTLDAALEWSEERILAAGRAAEAGDGGGLPAATERAPEDAREGGGPPAPTAGSERPEIDPAEIGRAANDPAANDPAGNDPAGDDLAEAGFAAFAGAGLDLRRLRPYLERLELEAGHRLVEQGASADALYFIGSGRVTAQLECDGLATRLESMGRGSLVGELAFYRGGERTASVVANEPSTVYRLTHPAMERLTRQEPALAAGFHALIVRLMAERVVHLMTAVEELQG